MYAEGRHRDQPPAAAKVPRGHRREPPMVPISLVITIDVLMARAVPLIRRAL
jgi:hypothetical protein